MAEIRITDAPRFEKWAKDLPMAPEATDAELQRWKLMHWICDAEEGYALTVAGRRQAGLPIGPLKAPSDGDSNG